jgi:hypothetical protein
MHIFSQTSGIIISPFNLGKTYLILFVFFEVSGAGFAGHFAGASGRVVDAEIFLSSIFLLLSDYAIVIRNHTNEATPRIMATQLKPLSHFMMLSNVVYLCMTSSLAS